MNHLFRAIILSVFLWIAFVYSLVAQDGNSGKVTRDDAGQPLDVLESWKLISELGDASTRLQAAADSYRQSISHLSGMNTVGSPGTGTDEYYNNKIADNQFLLRMMQQHDLFRLEEEMNTISRKLNSSAKPSNSWQIQKTQIEERISTLERHQRSLSQGPSASERSKAVAFDQEMSDLDKEIAALDRELSDLTSAPGSNSGNLDVDIFGVDASRIQSSGNLDHTIFGNSASAQNSDFLANGVRLEKRSEVVASDNNSCGTFTAWREGYVDKNGKFPDGFMIRTEFATSSPPVKISGLVLYKDCHLTDDNCTQRRKRREEREAREHKLVIKKHRLMIERCKRDDYPSWADEQKRRFGATY